MIGGLAGLWAAALAAGLVTPADDLEIAEPTVLRPGVYTLADRGRPGLIRVTGEGVTVECTGVTLYGSPPGTLPDKMRGLGLMLEGSGLTLKGGVFRGFHIGVMVRKSREVSVEGVDVSQGYGQRLEGPGRPFLNLRSVDAWRGYGAGIWVEGGRAVHVTSCTGRRRQNGLVLVRSRGGVVRGNEFSFLSGWGVALWESSGNTLRGNAMDFCYRGGDGGDAAALVLVADSHDNVIEENSLTYSGDGLFLTNQSNRPDGRGECNGNLIRRNDGSYASANAFEATFSERNRFEGNVGSFSNYGWWTGYSRDQAFLGNRVEGNRSVGIAIEHGRGSRFEGNVFAGNGQAALRLWGAPSRTGAGADPSEDYLIAGNTFGRAPGAGVVLAWTRGVRLTGNVCARDLRFLQKEGGVRDLEARDNGAEVGELPAPLLSLWSPAREALRAQGRRLERGAYGAQMGLFGPLDLMRPDDPHDAWQRPRPPRAHLGVRLGDREEGVTLEEVSAGSPAQRAGLKVGDVVVRCDGVQVRSSRGVVDRVRRARPGERLTLTVQRGEEEVEAAVTLGAQAP